AVAGWLDAFVDDDVLPLSQRDQIKNPSGLGFWVFENREQFHGLPWGCEGLAGRRAEVVFSRFFFLIFLTS
ncbi:hypothetical protein, partial [Klebsiella pneumoniae]|uniref:hypothetical protein n=1 Tax=Klebsiella pneumoniae TaxID=573 RepID=UPI0015F348CC